jgi:GMP synthase (glutamine-hydrolysing)
MTQTAHPDTVLIVDFGSQVTQLIARRVREIGVYCEIVPVPVGRRGLPAPQAEGRDPVRRPGLGDLDRLAARAAGIFDSGLPVLGICYGQQTMCDAARRQGRERPRREFGRALSRSTTPHARCSRASGKGGAIRSG